ncbi:hypothetical protein ACHWQZ_G000360 [Mnemiopsis leidyi]
MSSCLQTVFCCWKSTSNRLFYQNSDTDERGIEYDRLIELPECNVRTGGGGGRLPAPQLILNERERHLISNRLYSEYADDQDRFNRLADEELLKDEARLAMEEEEHYAQKTSQIREFYQNRPPTTSSGATQDFADFSSRLPLHSTPISGDFVSQPVTSVSDNHARSTVNSDSCVNVLVTDHVTKDVLSAEQSDKLIKDIDDILQDRVSESTDMSEFYPEHSDPDVLSDISPEFPESTVDLAGNPADYFLTNVVLDDSPSPANFVRAPSPTLNPVVSNDEVKCEQTEGNTFDPFMEFSRKTSVNSSEESFVKIE